MNNNQQGQLLVCPVCFKRKVKNVLGSIDASGVLFIQRLSNRGMTIVYSSDMYIVCTCGFGTQVYTTKKSVYATYPAPKNNTA